MANKLDDRFLNKENFYLAFKRLRNYLYQNNEWYDPIEISSYEANLETNLIKLIDTIKNDTYKTKPIEPLPFPKKNQNGEDVIRPYFKISIDDQLVWIAIVNVIGKYLEDEMPNWSYGNRLFRPVWFEDKGNHKVIKFGSFHNSSPNLYRKWNQSWPLFRRYISITIKSMGYGKKFDTSKLDFAHSKITKFWIICF